MGIWDWVFGKISKSVPEAPKERGVATRHAPDAPMVAVATIEGGKHLEIVKPESAPWWSTSVGASLDPIYIRVESTQPSVAMLEKVLVTHFDGHDLSMPLLNHVAEQILPKLRRANFDLKEIARDIAADQVLSAAVLRTVNSPMYRGVAKTTTVPAAVTRIGVKALRTILLHESVRSAIFAKNSATKQFANILWRRSLGDACIMRGLAGLMRMDEDDCHLIGLVHDIGSVLVLRIITDQLKMGKTTIDLNSFEYLRHQTHQEFGELVAEAWQLPPELTALIKNHHTYPESNDPLARHRWMLLLTEMIGGILYFEKVQNYDLIRCRPAAELDLSDRADYRTWLLQLPTEIDQTLTDLQS